MENSESVVGASEAFGRYVHIAAVRVGSKTELGKLVGRSKEDIQKITRGLSHTLEKEVLEDVFRAASPVLPNSAQAHMRALIQTMKPAD